MGDVREKGQIFGNGRGWVSNNRRERERERERESTDWKVTHRWLCCVREREREE